MNLQGRAKSVARSMESQIWHPPSGSVALWEEVSEKGQWPLLTSLSGRKLSTCLDARHFSSSLCDSGIFQAATPVLDLTGSEFE